MTVFPKLPSVNDISLNHLPFWTRIKPNAVATTLVFTPYTKHYTWYVFLVILTDLNKQLLNVKSVFEFLNCGFNVLEIYRFITFLGIEILCFTKQCPLKCMSNNKCWSTKVGAKLLSDLVIFSTFSFHIPLDFQESIWVVPLKYLIYFLAGINTK